MRVRARKNPNFILFLTLIIIIVQALLRVKEGLQKDMGREPTEGELADATNMSVAQVKRVIEVGQAARNKLIKVIRVFNSLACIFQKLI